MGNTNSLILKVLDTVTDFVMSIKRNNGKNSQIEAIKLPVSSLLVIYIRINSQYFRLTGYKTEIS